MNLSSNILDYLRIRFWLYEDSIFHYPEEKLTPATGLPPVEPKGKLIEICLQMFHAYTSLVRSEYPSFEQRRNSVDKRKVFFPNLGKTGHFDVIAIAFFNARVALKAVRPYSTASGNVPGYKMLYGVFSSVINFFKSDSPDTLSPHVFNRNQDDTFTRSSTPSLSRFLPSHEGFVKLNRTLKFFSARPDHCEPEFMKKHPCTPIAANSENLFEIKSAGAVFLGANPPGCPEPNRQGHMGVLKNCSGDHGLLPPAVRAFIKSVVDMPCLVGRTPRANKPFRPPEPVEIFSAPGFIGEAVLKFFERMWIVFHMLFTLYVVLTLVKCISQFYFLNISLL